MLVAGQGNLGKLGVLVWEEVWGDVVGECLEIREVLGSLGHWDVEIWECGGVARYKVYGEVVEDVLDGGELGLCLREVGGRVKCRVGKGRE